MDLVVVVLNRARIRGTTSTRGVCVDLLLYSDYSAVAPSQGDVSNFKVGQHGFLPFVESIDYGTTSSRNVLYLHHLVHSNRTCSMNMYT